jgi:hypothetical protein
VAVTNAGLRCCRGFWGLLLCAGLLAGCGQRPAPPPADTTPTPDQIAIAARETIDASLRATPVNQAAPTAQAPDVTPTEQQPDAPSATPTAADTPSATPTTPATSATTDTTAPTSTPLPTSTPTPDLSATSAAQAAALETGIAATLAARAAEIAQATQMAAAVAATLTAQAPTLTPTPIPSLTPRPTATPLPATAPRLAYAYGNVRDSDIRVFDPASGVDRAVADRSCDEAEPGWGADGVQLFYHSDCAGSYDLYAVNVDSGAVQQLTTSTCDEREPERAPDGRRLVYRRNCTPEAYNVDGELWVLNLVDGSETALGVSGRAPAWSPDGARLAFISDRANGWEIYVYDFASGGTRQLTDCAANCRFPAWSPDGRFVAYHATTGPTTAEAESIWVAPAQGGAAQLLVSGAGAGRATWSATGWVAFNSQNGIEQVDARGEQRRVLLRNDSHWAPAWSR